jgi:type VI secretion system protein ImpE
MTANQLLDAGRLADAISKLSDDIRTNPTDLRARVFLFELLCFSGDLARAQKQLDAVTANEVKAEIAVARYRNLLAAEAARRDVFSGKSQPQIVGPRPEYIDLHIQAAKEIHEGKPDAALLSLERAADLRKPVSGRANGEPFDDFRDCDDVVAPFLEAFIEGTYNWIPWESVRSLLLSSPKYLRDLCWTPVKLELHSGPAGETYLPVLYAGSYLHSDDRIRLGRLTDWRTDCGELSLGIGQRLFAVGDDDRAVLEIREVWFDHADSNYSAG